MISDLTAQIIDSAIEQVRHEKNRARIQKHVVDPVIRYIVDKLWPYMVGCCVVFALIILLTLIVIFLIVSDKFRKS